MAKGKKTGGRDWKPGESGNLNGAPGYPKDIRESRKLNQQELERTINRLIYLTPAELRAVLDNPPTMFEQVVGNIIALAGEKGDHQRLEFILQRMIGRVTDKIEVQTKPFIVRNPDGTPSVVLGSKLEEE